MKTTHIHGLYMIISKGVSGKHWKSPIYDNCKLQYKIKFETRKCIFLGKRKKMCVCVCVFVYVCVTTHNLLVYIMQTSINRLV